MRRIFYGLVVTLLLPGWQASTKAQDVVPAGTLLQCTLDEPNFSSATADVGDPIVCQLSSIEEFGRVVVARGSYLAGHLEAYKEPGHFVGKGYLKLEFDRIGLPDGIIHLPCKIVAVRGYRVNRRGDIVGHGGHGGMVITAPLALEGFDPAGAGSAPYSEGREADHPALDG